MADFLSRLAERSRGQADAVRPRLASRFEPDPGLLVDDAVLPRDEDDAFWSVADRTQPPTLLPAAAPSSPPDNADGPTPAASTAPPSQATADGERPARMPRPRPVERGTTQPRASSLPPADRSAPEPRPDLPGVSGSPSRPDAVRPRLDVGAPAADPAPSSSDMVAQTDLGGPATPVPLVSVRREGTARQQDRQSAREDRRPAEPEVRPTIRVSIGRVEVRAVFPAPAPAPIQARPSPRLTIDEYLKQRAEGRR